MGLLALALAGGCTGGGDSGSGSAEDAGTQPVIAPGRPGEPAGTLSPDEAREAARDSYAEPNAADVAFMAKMIEHHGQALLMADLADTRASDGSVRRLAERIARAQEPEIGVMEDWLDDNAEGGAGGEAEGHGHAGDMPGMATEEDLAELRGARGADFDALFLDLMIAHHEGAVEMATDEAAQGSASFVVELAAEMAATQGAEIDRMENLR
ncbi:DUF305 domain-containing protein [Streptomyces sp. 6N223]|uniref:DUF305 domain-containing protein n=1 Tax=Streptomyces sp. 6N223 TaxID=3457412 RepID=UPI003FD5A3C2